MLEKAIQKIASMAESKTYLINGDTYSDRDLIRIPSHIDKPRSFELSGLDGIAKMIRAEITAHPAPMFVRVTGPTQVDVYTTYLQDASRVFAYTAKADVPDFRGGFFFDHMETIIRLRSRFVPNEGQEYLLSLLSRMNLEQSATSTDNGVTQRVEARQGIALNSKETIKPIVKLRPYRTFHEVEQPESEFLIRVDDRGNVGLFEADGGAWKLQAKKNIAAYFEEVLKDLVESGSVIVTI